MFFVIGRHVHTRVVDTGRFWCLYCEAERPYQRRVWSSSLILFFVPLRASRGEFVFCPVCESAFDTRCLDETTTATIDELVMEVPLAALRAGVRVQPRRPPVGQVDTALAEERPVPAPATAPAAASAGTDTSTPESQGERRSVKGLSARSRSRRH